MKRLFSLWSLHFQILCKESSQHLRIHHECKACKQYLKKKPLNNLPDLLTHLMKLYYFLNNIYRLIFKPNVLIFITTTTDDKSMVCKVCHSYGYWMNRIHHLSTSIYNMKWCISHTQIAHLNLFGTCQMKFGRLQRWNWK